MRGPKDTETACLPSFVTAETDGSRDTVVVFASQLKFISELRDIPAPLFQLCERKGWKNIWLISLRSSSPAKDHSWFIKKPYVKPAACFRIIAVGPIPHLRALKKSLVPVGIKNAGPSPHIKPFLLLMGVKKALMVASLNPN